MAYRPSCSTRITGVLRILPLLTPRLVTITTGRPVSRSVVPRVPPEPSYSSTWSRTHAAVLGSYSPSTGIPDSQHQLSAAPRPASPSGDGRPRSHEPGRAAHDIFRICVQQNANSPRDDSARNEVNREVAVHNKKPVDRLRVVGNQPFPVSDRIGPTADPDRPAVLAVV